MDRHLPAELLDYLAELDRFIEATIKPLENSSDNIRFFDHRREWARTDYERGGLPHHDWEALLKEMRRLADAAGHFRFALPREYGGRDGSHLAMAVIREHLAAKGLGLHNDLQNESSIVGNMPTLLLLRDFGSPAQKEKMIPGVLEGRYKLCTAMTEPEHGSDATWMETTAVRDGDGWVMNGEKMWNTGVDSATHDLVFARTSGKPGDARGITCFIVPTDATGFDVKEFYWTMNMPTDHPRVELNQLRLPLDAVLGNLDEGLDVAQHFVHENRIRQAASSLGAAQFCINESVRHANARKPFGKALAGNQAIQFPLVELHTEAAMLRALIHKTASEMDGISKKEVAERLSDKVSMCNYRANRLACDAADFAIQVHGAMGYSRHKPFEHIYRHHRRYRITEGSDEIQMRRVAQVLFGVADRKKAAREAAR